jgi:16S rRNA (guanine966-N2)-methyltransferase
MASNEVRIIGGKWRGRKLVFPDQIDLRPTLGRVRETLFNWLRADIGGSRCLDLFAGSGALGFEALSRGAATVTFVDTSRKVTQCIRDNARRLGAEDLTVVCSRADQALRRGLGPWDIIFLDPPFSSGELTTVLALIRSTEALADGGLIYLEAPRREALDLDDWRELKHGQAGETQFGLLASP